ncbi:2'-5' RNA ligase family protein [Streptomyces sp. NPDC020965]|uniref:2'-5' RNA ligase family protein n=1 Tax=Streptomyces sp. NPDC020965 TaxID=3365105 RepID=UPI00379FF5B4
MANHWWWRPGWGPGTRFYAWHLTFDDAPDVHRYLAEARGVLDGVPGLDLVPDQWLHLTMQGVGDVQDVSPDDVQAISQAAARRITDIPVFDLRLGAPMITPEAVASLVEPAEPVRALRAAIRDAIREVWQRVPEDEDGFVPHVSVAYSNGDGPAAPVQTALDTLDAEPPTCTVTHADLIAIGRDEQMYTWETIARAPLKD